MRFFYVALAETRRDILAAIIDVIREWDERAKRHNIRVGVLIRYTKWRSRPCLPCKMAKDAGLPVFIDNGAFSFLTANDLEGTPSPFTLSRWRADYAVWLAENRDDYDLAALPDIPVHGRNFLPARARRKRIRLSTRNQAGFLRLIPGKVRAKMVPVIQGYTVVEYEESFKQLVRARVLSRTAYSLNQDYAGILAVGSVCVRKWSSGGQTGILAGGKAAGTLREWLPRFLDECCGGVARFHLFGLHREATSTYGWHPRFFAADSGAHGLNYRYKWKTVLGCTAPNTPDCAAKAVDRQLRRTLQPLLTTPVLSFF